MATRTRGRFLLFLLSTWLLIFLCAELVAQVGFHLLPGSSPLRRLTYPSRFSLHRVTRLTNDHRVATLIPGYRGDFPVDEEFPAKGRWHVEIDENGFRGRKDTYEGRRQVIAFIGDSVPFGWGVSDEATVPSRFQTLLRGHGVGDVGVLNGAVPSYSLSQAVEHFQREISGKYPLRSVILQTLDPALLFSFLGERWNPRIAFTTRLREPTQPLLGPLENYLDKSLLFAVSLRVAYRLWYGSREMNLQAIGEAAWQKFDEQNATPLLELLEAVRPYGASVVLLPVNPGAEPETAYSARERDVIDHFNRFLAKFASGHPGVYFFDVKERFEAHPDDASLFVDTCCHLSEEGARLQAQYLFDKYQERGLLPPRELETSAPATSQSIR